jgi:membrane associated rhomboid family serine protease
VCRLCCAIAVQAERQVVSEGLRQFRNTGRLGLLDALEKSVYLRSIHSDIIPPLRDRKPPLLPIRDVNPTRARPIITWTLIAVCAAVFFFIQPPGGSAQEVRFLYRQAAIACELTTARPLSMSEIDQSACVSGSFEAPVFPDKNVWLSVGVSMFLHAGIAHLLFNMWSLWIFGNNVEEAFGVIGFILFYAAAGVVSTAGFAVFNPHLTVPLVGASGAIAGVMGAYLVLFPRHLVLTLVIFRVVALPSILFLGIWLASQFLLVDQASGVAWEAHVVGFAFGALVALVFRRRLLANVWSAAPPRPQRVPGA